MWCEDVKYRFLVSREAMLFTWFLTSLYLIWLLPSSLLSGILIFSQCSWEPEVSWLPGSQNKCHTASVYWEVNILLEELLSDNKEILYLAPCLSSSLLAYVLGYRLNLRNLLALLHDRKGIRSAFKELCLRHNMKSSSDRNSLGGNRDVFSMLGGNAYL